MHAYHYSNVQHPREEDYPRRKIFCEDFFRRTDEDPKFSLYVIFNDESLFIQGVLNSHVWDDENPRERLKSFQIRWKLNLGWDYGNKNIGPSNPPRKTKWRIICAIFDRKSIRLQENLLRRMRACVTMNGGHFEHLL